MEMAVRKRKRKRIKNYQPLFYILLIKGGGNQSLLWPKKRPLFSFLLGCYPFKMYAQQ
jgi:hypothetical protein